MPFERRLGAALEDTFDAEPAVIVRSPGRVNLIGDHTDYNDGLAMPLAIDVELHLAARRREDGRMRLWSEVDGQVHDLDAASVTDGDRWPDWTVYVQGVLRRIIADPALRHTDVAARLERGLDLAVVSDLPAGAGLSSSAAIELAVVRAVESLMGIEPDAVRGARWGREAENLWVGVATGIMDQLAVACGRADHALLLDCREESWTHVPIPEDIEVLILDTGARRSLVGSAYDDRRRDCEEAAEQLGVASLRDLDESDLGALSSLPARLAARVRHVVGENARVRAVADALVDVDRSVLAAALNASHASLRDDYEVSGPELDIMAAIAQDTAGVIGARMTGGGFAGAVVALAEAEQVDHRALLDRYAAEVQLPAQVLRVRAAAGTSLTHG